MKLQPDHEARLTDAIRHCAPSETDHAWKYAADLLRSVTYLTTEDIREVCGLILDRYRVKVDQ